MTKRPHIIMFNPDEWRGDVLGHLGNPAAVTPVLDAWVETDAVSFSNAYCQSPVCTPSRCSFLTGWYPHVRGHRTMEHMLQPDEPMLLKTLKDEGYFVWWGGKNDVVPAQHGFDAYSTVHYRPSEKLQPMWGVGSAPEETWRGKPGSDTYHSFYTGCTEKDADAPCYVDRDWAMVHGAIEAIQHAPKDQPLCLYLPLTYPHPPYGVEEPWYSMIDRHKLPPRSPWPDQETGVPSMLRGLHDVLGLQEWDESRWNELRATYYGMCARVDHQFGLILAALREAGIYDESAVFFFSDHGDFAGDYDLVEKAQNLFPDCLTRVPLLIKPPASVPLTPRVSDALVELIDVPATIEALTGVTPRHTHFGRSLLPLLSGESNEGRDAVFCEGGRLMQELHASEGQPQLRFGNGRARGLLARVVGGTSLTRESLLAALTGEPAKKNLLAALMQRVIFTVLMRRLRLTKKELVGALMIADLYQARISVQVRQGPEHTKAVMCRTREFKYVRRLYESDELYDLRCDPQEQHNRIADPHLADVLLALKERLLTFYEETSDVVPQRPDRRF